MHTHLRTELNLINGRQGHSPLWGSNIQVWRTLNECNIKVKLYIVMLFLCEQKKENYLQPQQVHGCLRRNWKAAEQLTTPLLWRNNGPAAFRKPLIAKQVQVFFSSLGNPLLKDLNVRASAMSNGGTLSPWQQEGSYFELWALCHTSRSHSFMVAWKTQNWHVAAKACIMQLPCSNWILFGCRKQI